MGKFKDFEDKDIYIIEEQAGVRYIHILGYFWQGGNVMHTDYTNVYIPLDIFIKKFKNEGMDWLEVEWYECCTEYDDELDGIEDAEKDFGNYGGKGEPQPLLFKDVTMETPVGVFFYNGENPQAESKPQEDKPLAIGDKPNRKDIQRIIEHYKPQRSWEDVTINEIKGNYDVDDFTSMDSLSACANAIVNDVAGDGLDIRCEYTDEIVSLYHRFVRMSELKDWLEFAGWEVMYSGYDEYECVKGDDTFYVSVSNGDSAYIRSYYR